jgi:hypothetical protein
MLNFRVCNNEYEFIRLERSEMKSNTKAEEKMESCLARGDHGRLEVQINYTEPIFGDVEVVSVCPIENNPRNTCTRTMSKDKDIMIIEVRFLKCKKTVIV